jgi:hypothetical protein
VSLHYWKQEPIFGTKFKVGRKLVVEFQERFKFFTFFRSNFAKERESDRQEYDTTWGKKVLLSFRTSKQACMHQAK